jgi:hypothetical protein
MTTITFKHTEDLLQHESDQLPTTLPPLPDSSNWPYPTCPNQQTNNSKCIITVKNPAPWQQQQLQAINNSPPTDTYQAALVELGRLLLKDEDQTPWMSLRKMLR